jgi:predicted  nucleic acid-binding Zn-ribbon protein
MKNAVKAAEDYAAERRGEQNAYIEELKQNWHSFENSENEKLEKMLSEDEQRLELKTAELKDKLRISQKKKADMISERLKEEVLSLYGNR